MNSFPMFKIYRGPKWRIEERVMIVLCGNQFTSPTLKVTDEERKRWPEAYANFRSSLSIWTKFRLKLQHIADRRYVAVPPDPSTDVHFQALVESCCSGYKFHDGMVENDIRAALLKHEAA